MEALKAYINVNKRLNVPSHVKRNYFDQDFDSAEFLREFRRNSGTFGGIPMCEIMTVKV